jgi:hypothetical protein
MKKSRRVFLILLLLGAASGLAWHYYTPQVYRTATSPDHSWTVKITRQRQLGIPAFSPVDVTAIVANSAGKELLRTTFDTVDLWSDVPTHYSEVICRNDRILIGPEYWDGKGFGHFEITKADFKNQAGEQSATPNGP